MGSFQLHVLPTSSGGVFYVLDCSTTMVPSLSIMGYQLRPTGCLIGVVLFFCRGAVSVVYSLSRQGVKRNKLIIERGMVKIVSVLPPSPYGLKFNKTLENE